MKDVTALYAVQTLRFIVVRMCNYVHQERLHIPYNAYSTGGDYYTYGMRVCALVS